tara:strand:- start:1992 stop:2267 length:276 start_codon:yes stop_codon:yes gene_type:complete
MKQESIIDKLNRYAKENNIPVTLGYLSLFSREIIIRNIHGLVSTKQWVSLGTELDEAKIKLGTWYNQTRPKSNTDAQAIDITTIKGGSHEA